VDTTAGRWKDTNGGGIIADDTSMRQALVRGQSLDSVLSDDSAVVDNAATHYAGAQGGKYRWLRKRFTLHGIVDRLLRKTVKRNTWIYVSVNINPRY
jgi:hypothetical protein